MNSSLLPLTHPLVDHRVYTIALRKMPEFLDVFGRLAMPVLLETLGHPLGFYTSVVGPQNQFVHLWGYQDLADYEGLSGRVGPSDLCTGDTPDSHRTHDLGSCHLLTFCARAQRRMGFIAFSVQRNPS
jgi:hypothetical protein